MAAPVRRDVAPPQSAFDAANRAYDAAYHQGRDELIGALQAASPRIRLDEAEGLAEALNATLSTITDPAVHAAVSEALSSVRARVVTLAEVSA